MRKPKKLYLAIYQICINKSRKTNVLSVLLAQFFVKTTVADCPALRPPVNGVLDRGCGTRVGNVCRIYCKKGCQLVGDPVRRCLANNTWSGSPTQCVGKHIRCGPLNAPTNGYKVVGCGNKGDYSVFSFKLLNFLMEFNGKSDVFVVSHVILVTVLVDHHKCSVNAMVSGLLHPLVSQQLQRRRQLHQPVLHPIAQRIQMKILKSTVLHWMCPLME